MTAATLVAFLKKYSSEKKGQTLDQLVASAAVAVANESRRAMLLKTYASLSTSAQKSSMNKFSSSSAGAAASSSSSPSSSAAGAMLGEKYRLLSTGSQGPRISSGKSAVVDAVAIDNNKNTVLKAKLSRNLVALQREADNLKALRGVGAGARKAVIEVFDFLENYDGRGSHAVVMEAGEEDLVGSVRRGGALSRKELKKACAAVVEVLVALERKQLVWTDLRASNFVVMPAKGGGGVKAIDLESAVPVGEKPVDCTPEVTPPEVALLYVQGRLTQAVVATSYDVWSLGILLLFLASGGKNLFDGEASSRVMASLASATQEKVEGQVEKLVSDAKTAAFIKKLLVVDPRQRPSVGTIKKNLLFF
jgi:serine/threonine protein kinase